MVQIGNIFQIMLLNARPIIPLLDDKLINMLMIIVTFMSAGFVIVLLLVSGGEYSLLQTTQEQTLALLRVPPLSHSETTKIKVSSKMSILI